MIIWHIWYLDTLTAPFFSQYTLCNYVSKLHYMYFLKLYPTHMWYKNLASILGLPSRCSPNQNGLEKSMEQTARGRPATRSSVCLTILAPRSQSRGQESHRFCPCPCFWDLFRSHRWFRARSLCSTKASCTEPSVASVQRSPQGRSARSPDRGMQLQWLDQILYL